MVSPTHAQAVTEMTFVLGAAPAGAAAAPRVMSARPIAAARRISRMVLPFLGCLVPFAFRGQAGTGGSNPWVMAVSEAVTSSCAAMTDLSGELNFFFRRGDFPEVCPAQVGADRSVS